jgi:hypothetical protein
MPEIPPWKNRFTEEIQRAESARNAGNEGMARVCARRAAGVVAGEYLRIHGISLPGPSAYVRLKVLQQLPQTPAPIQDIVDHFLIRINPDHNLPVQADLIAEARWLASELLTRTN